MKLLFIPVNYNTFSSLEKYLLSISLSLNNASSNINLDVIIADNSSEKKYVDDSKYNFSVVQIFTENNLGYLGAVSFAIATQGLSLSEYDFIAISNVDLQISTDFFENIEKLSLDPSVGCIAPSIISENEHGERNPQSLSRYSKKKLQVLKLMYSLPILYYIYIAFFYSKRQKAKHSMNIKEIYAAHGSFMLFTNRFSSFLQNFKYPTFLFGEEIYFAEHLKKKGLKTIYEPSLVIYDSDHETTSKLKKKTYFKYNKDAIAMILKEFYK